MKEQLFIACIYSVIFSGIFFIAELIRHYFPNLKEISRKSAHVLCGMVALSFPCFITSHWMIFGLVLVFSLLMLISKKKKLLSSIHEVGRRSYGSFYYPLAIYLIYLLASKKPAIYLISILTMTISDAFAALIGRKYGTIKFEVEGSIKSLEGSGVFLLVSFLCVHLPLLLMTDIGRVNAVLIALIIAILLTGFEAISPTGSDNIVVPFGTYYLLTKMTVLPLSSTVQDMYTLLGVIVITGFLSMLNASGLIGLMLINYAAITLGSYYWAIPLVLTELLFFLMIRYSTEKQKEKFPLWVIFYLGVIPIGLIFLENSFKVHSLLFIPYLVAIASQLPMSYQFARLEKGQLFYATLAVLFVTLPSIFFYQKKLVANSLIITLSSIVIIYILNYLFHKFAHQNHTDKNEFRLRFLSTAVGSIIAFSLSLIYGVHHV